MYKKELWNNMEYLNKILNNCNEASLLAIKRKDVKIGFKQQFELRVHLYFCKCCQNFEKQSAIIDLSLQKYFSGENPAIKASEDFKAKLKSLLK